MALVLFDSNILIDALKGYEQALIELAYWNDPAISSITWMEVYAGATLDEIPKLNELMETVRFKIFHTSDVIMQRATQIRSASLRQNRKTALPDAIIMATAQELDAMLITRNKKDFKGRRVRVPYELRTQTLVQVVNIVAPDAERGQ
ncbi:PIN domain-containing protein [Pseudoduganella danionis]|uniref:PIN domain-containing protein n=1 Tax=Pseudoduganella danionis TaxID=1890295 RepID=UPI0035ADF330